MSHELEDDPHVTLSLLISIVSIRIWMNNNTHLLICSLSHDTLFGCFKKFQVFVETEGSSPPEIPSFMPFPAPN
jgi:hypothetical protein